MNENWTDRIATCSQGQNIEALHRQHTLLLETKQTTVWRHAQT